MELSLLFVNCLLVSGAEVIYGQLLEQPSLNAQTCVASRLAPLLDEGVASSSVRFPLMYNSPPPLISPISSLLISGERARHFYPVDLPTPLPVLLSSLSESSPTQKT